MTEVEIISTCLVKMANNDHSYGISRVELTPWDLQLILLDPIQKGIFLYKPQNQEFEKTFIDHLKTSFSRALDFYPPLAGRFACETTTDNKSCFYIDCNNAGALFAHAIAPRGVCVRDILNSLHTPNIVRSFFPLNGVSNSDGVTHPLLGVQVTEFVDGFFVGCTFNHSLADGTSFWHFVNSWSEISRGLEKISKLPVFERSFNDFLPLNFPIPIPTPEPKSKLSKSSSTPLLERVFHFGKENLSKLKAMSNFEAGSTTTTISSFQALIAHVWRGVMRNRGVDPANEVGCILVIGTRMRLPLPDNYFGNALHFAHVTTKNVNLISKGLGWAALEINKVVSMQTRDEAIKMLEGLSKNMNIDKKGLLLKNGILLSSSPRHNVYDVDFGWGKPVAVRSGAAQKYDGKITVFPNAEGGGIDVEACLAPETLIALENDKEFMECVDF